MLSASLREGELLLWIQNYLRWEPMNRVWVGITALGEKGIFWITLALILICIQKRRNTGHMALISIIIGFICGNLILKNLAIRIRPYEVVSGLTILIEKQPDWSFPSGHTIVSFSFAFVILRHLPKRIGIPTVILAALVAFSRLYLGVHYPSDILGGIIVAYLSSLIAEKIEKKIALKWEKTKIKTEGKESITK